MSSELLNQPITLGQGLWLGLSIFFLLIHSLIVAGFAIAKDKQAWLPVVWIVGSALALLLSVDEFVLAATHQEATGGLSVIVVFACTSVWDLLLGYWIRNIIS